MEISIPLDRSVGSRLDAHSQCLVRLGPITSLKEINSEACIGSGCCDQ